MKPYFEIEKVLALTEHSFWLIVVRDDSGVPVTLTMCDSEESAHELLRLILLAAENPDETRLATLWNENDARLT